MQDEIKAEFWDAGSGAVCIFSVWKNEVAALPPNLGCTPHSVTQMLEEMRTLRAPEAKGLICLGSGKKIQKSTQHFQLRNKAEMLIPNFNTCSP